MTAEETFHWRAFSSSMMSAISGSTSSSGAFSCFGHCTQRQTRDTRKINTGNKQNKRMDRKQQRNGGERTVTPDLSSVAGRDAYEDKSNG
jgi:hypothetical protein